MSYCGSLYHSIKIRGASQQTCFRTIFVISQPEDFSPVFLQDFVLAFDELVLLLGLLLQDLNPLPGAFGVDLVQVQPGRVRQVRHGARGSTPGVVSCVSVADLDDRQDVDGRGHFVDDLSRQVLHFVERRQVDDRQASLVAFETRRHGVESTTESVGALTRQRQSLDDALERFVDARVALEMNYYHYF